MIWSSARFWQQQDNVILSSTVSKFNSVLNNSSIWMKLLAKLGFSPYPEKNSAIHNIPTPACKQDLQRLFGMINYLSNYIPNMSELTAPLWSLLKGDVSWAWFAEHDSALTKINTVLSSAPVLRFYDEMLTIVLGCERFNMYTHRAEVNSDHKPLKTIFKKPLFKVPPAYKEWGCVSRSITLKLSMSQESVRTLLIPSPGHTMSPVCPVTVTCIKTWSILFTVLSSLPISDVKLKELRNLNSNDPTMQMLH